MAFAFFRRRQKMVIIIMAVLMVSFLIGFQGFQTLFAKKPGERVLGRTTQGEIRVRDTEMARSDLDVVSMTGLGDRRRLRSATSRCGSQKQATSSPKRWCSSNRR